MLERRGGVTPRKLSGTGSVKERERDFAEPGSAGPPPPPRALAAGAEIIVGLEDTPYGSREYAARDLEGHVWSFGNYAPELK